MSIQKKVYHTYIITIYPRAKWKMYYYDPGKTAGRDGSRIALGQTRAGRYRRVIYNPDPKQESVFIITAFELTGKPLAAYKSAGSERKNEAE